MEHIERPCCSDGESKGCLVDINLMCPIEDLEDKLIENRNGCTTAKRLRGESASLDMKRPFKAFVTLHQLLEDNPSTVVAAVDRMIADPLRYMLAPRDLSLLLRATPPVPATKVAQLAASTVKRLTSSWQARAVCTLEDVRMWQSKPDVAYNAELVSALQHGAPEVARSLYACRMFSPVQSHFPQPLFVASSPDDSMLAAAFSDGQTVLWAAQTGEAWCTLPINPRGGTGEAAARAVARCVAFSPDGCWMAVGGIAWTEHISGGYGRAAVSTLATTVGLIRLYDMTGESPVLKATRGGFLGHTGTVCFLKFSADNKFLYSCSALFGRSKGDGSVRRWSVESGTAVGPPLTGDACGYVGCTVSLTTPVQALCTAEGKVRVWTVQALKEAGPTAIFAAGGGSSRACPAPFFPTRIVFVASVALSCDETKLLVAGCTQVAVWNWEAVHMWDGVAPAPAPLYVSRIGGVNSTILAATFSPDGSRVAVSGTEGELWQFHACSGTKYGPPLFSHNGAHVRSLLYSSDGKWLVSAGDDGTVTQVVSEADPASELMVLF